MKIEAETPRQGTPSEGGRADAAAAKSIQSCPILCDPIDGSPPGSPVPGILQARTLEWVAISFSNAWKWKVKSEVTQLCPTLCDPMDWSPPGSSVHGIFQARVLEWVAIAFSDTTHSWVIYYGIPKKLIMPTNLTPICIQTSPSPPPRPLTRARVDTSHLCLQVGCGSHNRALCSRVHISSHIPRYESQPWYIKCNCP